MSTKNVNKQIIFKDHICLIIHAHWKWEEKKNLNVFAWFVACFDHCKPYHNSSQAISVLNVGNHNNMLSVITQEWKKEKKVTQDLHGKKTLHI